MINTFFSLVQRYLFYFCQQNHISTTRHFCTPNRHYAIVSRIKTETHD